jgi:hypothetical protein
MGGLLMTVTNQEKGIRATELALRSIDSVNLLPKLLRLIGNNQCPILICVEKGHCVPYEKELIHYLTLFLEVVELKLIEPTFPTRDGNELFYVWSEEFIPGVDFFPPWMKGEGKKVYEVWNIEDLMEMEINDLVSLEQ